MKKRSVFLLFFLYLLITATAQPLHEIRGTVIDKASRKPLEFINVVIAGSGMGSVTDSVGHFTIQAVPPGIYRLQASAVGYKTTLTSEYILSTKNLNIDIEMEENPTELEGVTITASPFRRDLESPVGLRIIGVQEIEKSPGANRDISRVVQSYPGVAFSPAGYRNDLIVRADSIWMESKYRISTISVRKEHQEVPSVSLMQTLSGKLISTRVLSRQTGVIRSVRYSILNSATETWNGTH